MLVKISETPINPWQELEAYQTSVQNMAGKFGATSIFIGTLRDFNEGELINGMTLEHYPGMTEKCIRDAILIAEQRWVILDSLVVHRVGEVYPNQPIVIVAVWTQHRGDAFDACRFIMETLKSTAPFWKKEFLNASEVKHSETQVNCATSELYSSRSRWVTSNSDGYADKKQP
jgi:molybdopterin synthase catalytic subunit